MFDAERLVWAEANLRGAQVKAGFSQLAEAKTSARTRQAIRTIKEMFRKDGLLKYPAAATGQEDHRNNETD